MKVKALRYKEEFNKFKEFVHIQEMGGEPEVFTSDLPNIQPMTATMKLMKNIYGDKCFDLDKFELVEFDLIETGEVGADIRNKLTPYKNLVALVELLLDENDGDDRLKLKKFIRKEIVQSKKSVEYIAKLL